MGFEERKLPMCMSIYKIHAFSAVDTELFLSALLLRAVIKEEVGVKNEHEAFVVGEPLCDPTAKVNKTANGRLAVVQSTEHLLLNAWRAMVYGMPLQLLIDTEYRHMAKG